jgi:hypothetical protein
MAILLFANDIDEKLPIGLIPSATLAAPRRADWVVSRFCRGVIPNDANAFRVTH